MQVILPCARRQIAALGLTFLQGVDLTLADGSQGRSDVYSGVIVWQGEEINVRVVELDSLQLLGAGLLRGSRLCIDFDESGTVQIDPL